MYPDTDFSFDESVGSSMSLRGSSHPSVRARSSRRTSPLSMHADRPFPEHSRPRHAPATATGLSAGSDIAFPMVRLHREDVRPHLSDPVMLSSHAECCHGLTAIPEVAEPFGDTRVAA